MLEIPVNIDQNDFTIDVDLEGQIYTLHFSWNSAMQRWTLGFLDEFGDPILTGVPLLANAFLLQQHIDPRLPPGEMFAQFLQVGDPGRMSFVDKTAKLIYLTEEEDNAIQ